jgi:D-serine deaminase-like pyridoxal phosphate-dependent protein
MKISELDTPVLMIDEAALDRNIARMKEATEAAGVFYRPHAKTHKSVEIARRQIAAGAVGICCAKLGEAEVMAAGGIDNILITTAVIGESKIGRLIHARNSARIAVVADNADNIAMLGNVAQMSGQKLDVLVEIDIGQGRAGVPAGPEAATLAKLIHDHGWLNFGGIQGYQGKIQMVEDAVTRKANTESGLDKFADTIAEVEKAGIAVPVKTGGGTGTSPFDMERGLLTELQTGSYVFMDSRYNGIGWPGANAPPFEPALHILTSVVSKPVPDRVIVDAGLKSASSDHGPPVIADVEGRTYEFGGDEHGIIRMADGGEVPWNVGDKLRLIPSHCDTTVNLYDQYMVIQGDEVVDVWPVDTRGRTQ